MNMPKSCTTTRGRRRAAGWTAGRWRSLRRASTASTSPSGGMTPTAPPRSRPRSLSTSSPRRRMSRGRRRSWSAARAASSRTSPPPARRPRCRTPSRRSTPPTAARRKVSLQTAFPGSGGCCPTRALGFGAQMIVGLVIGLILGTGGAWLLLRSKNAELSARFGALAAEALHRNNESFLDLASGKLEQREHAVAQLVQPLKESLEKVSQHTEALERSRRQDYGSLSRYVQNLAETGERMRSETANLATALRSSEVRGAWGQMQLRNAVETAGMLAHCDFTEEVTTAGADGRSFRPDMVVRLPGGRQVVVDAKTPPKPLPGASADPEGDQDRYVDDFVRHVRQHARQLSEKAYWQQFDDAPDYVFMFLPGESFFRMAIERDPSLLELAGMQRVILVSPMMLLTLLRTIACIWNDAKVA